MKRKAVNTAKHCKLQVLNVNELPPVQDQIGRIYTNVILPETIPRENSQAPLEFTINANQVLYLMASALELELKVKVVKADGTALGANEPVTIINAPFFTMWKDVEVLNFKKFSLKENLF